MKVEMVVGDVNVEVGLDRLVLAIPYPKKLKDDLLNPITAIQLAKYEAEKAEFVSAMHYIKNLVVENLKSHVINTKSKDLKRYHVFFDDGGLMCIFTLGFCFGTGVINLELNPSKLSPKQFSELFSWLDLFFNLGYQELYTKAVVSHAEFFVDAVGEELSSLVILDNSRRKTTPHKGTTYIGRRGAACVTTMYDKAKEQKVEGKLVRVEARINRKDIRFQDLVEHDLFNPFGNVLVVNVNQVQLAAKAYGKSHFLNRIKEFGLNGCGINIHTRKKILAKLQQNTATWWQSKLFWKEHRCLLQKFKPELFGADYTINACSVNDFSDSKNK